MTCRVYTQRLLERGVIIPCPAAVEIADNVRPERIAPGVILHAGCRISGEGTSIGPDCEIGAETPATVHNCQLGRSVRLAGGSYSEATFLDGAHMGSGAHVRAGTLLEEGAGGAHTVAFKQTILFPFVTAGSLINFCDILMAGGTSRRNHSEIGSSYVHFNFTPHQDKATPSLIGDVPRGVMLDQRPIFLGGQGGLVGPARMEFGVVIPAGVICREDVLVPNQVFVPAALPAGQRPFVPGAYRAIQRIVLNNLTFIGNLWGLREWYRHVRKSVMDGDDFSSACWRGALERLDTALDERIRRLEELAERMPQSVELAQKNAHLSLPDIVLAQQMALAKRWPKLKQALLKGPDPLCGQKERDAFLAAWHGSEGTYLERIAGLPPEARKASTTWLQSIVHCAVQLWEPLQ